MELNLDLSIGAPHYEEVNTNLELGLPSTRLTTYEDNQAPNTSNERRRMTYQEAGFQIGSSALSEVNANKQRRLCATTIERHEIVEPREEAPIFECPICLGEVEEETSTKCGHIFCKCCITTTLAIERKCPTCRRKLRQKDIIRIYFPKRR